MLDQTGLDSKEGARRGGETSQVLSDIYSKKRSRGGNQKEKKTHTPAGNERANAVLEGERHSYHGQLQKEGKDSCQYYEWPPTPPTFSVWENSPLHKRGTSRREIVIQCPLKGGAHLVFVIVEDRGGRVRHTSTQASQGEKAQRKGRQNVKL